jgi:hypothetical protein
MREHPLVSRFAIACLTLLIVAGHTKLTAQETTSGDGYVRLDERTSTWALGTSMVEHRLQLVKGVFALTSFENKLSRRQYVSEATRGEEFRIVADGKEYTGLSGGWRLVGSDTSVLAQGEIQLVVRIENDLLRVEKTYVVYPSTSIIRQWVKYQNRSSGPLTVSNPYFLADRLRAGEADNLTLHYMTGGGFYTGCQTLKEVRLSKEYARTFESKTKTLSKYYTPDLDMSDPTDEAEKSIELAGMNMNFGYPDPYASGVYMPWFCLRDAQAGDGVFAGFDYLGRWAAEIGNYYGGPGYLGLRLGGFKQSLAPGGILGNAQSHCVQLPNTFAFARGAQGQPVTEADFVEFADKLMTGQGQLLVRSWQALAGTDSELMRTRADTLAALPEENLTPGSLGGLLFGSPQ